MRSQLHASWRSPGTASNTRKPHQQCASHPAFESLESRLLLSAADTIPPMATVVSPDVTVGGGASQVVTVTYTDNGSIDRSTVGHSDVTVTGPGGIVLPFKSVVAYPLGNASPVVATYVFDAPGGAWGPSDDGTYTATVGADTVFDTGGNGVAPTSGTFTVDIPAGAPRDTQPPSEVIAPAPRAALGTSSETVQVTYSDNVAVDPTDIDSHNIQVFAPNGQKLAITGVSESPAPDGKSVVATYTIAAPGGVWRANDAGTYTIKVLSGHVFDTSGNPNPLALSSFSVGGTPSPASGPQATVSPPPAITTAGGATQTVSVTYRSPLGISVGSIGPADLFVSRSGGPALTVTGVTVSPPAGGTAVTATYTVAAPTGAWESTDNGTYVVTIQPGQVTDLSGNAVASFSSSFQVNIPVPRPIIDPTFGNPQPSATDFTAESAAAQPDGKTVLVGYQGDIAAGTTRAVVERLNADGSLDTTFAAGGKYVTSAASGQAYYAVRLSPGGSIVAAGSENGNFEVARFRPNGTPDPSFGRGGQVITDLGGNDVAYALAVAPNGAVVAAGSSDAAFAFVHYLSDGRLDPFFGERGERIFALGAGAGNVVGDVAIQSDGSVTAAGASGGSVVLIHLDAHGSPLPSFGNNGAFTVPGLTARTDLSQADHSEGLAVAPDGNYLVANETPAGHFGVAQVTPAGSLDPVFGTGGIATASFGGNDDADRVFVQSSGQVLVVGTTNAGGTSQTAVAAFNPDGSLDTTFGSNGLYTAPADVTPIAGAAPAAGTLVPQALHIGDIFLIAFGSLGPAGRLLVGTSGGAPSVPAAPRVTTSLRRLFVPGTGLLGEFGAVASLQGKGHNNEKLQFIAGNGAVVIVTMKGGGFGQAFYDGNSVDMVLTGTGPHSVVTINTASKSRPFTLRNVLSSGPLHAFQAPAVSMNGTLAVAGALGSVTLSSLAGTIAAGPIGNVTVLGNVANATVISGANLGADGLLGGTGTAADAFAAGSIGNLNVGGTVTGSLIAAGLDPGPDAGPGSLLNMGTTVIGGARSRIGPVLVKGGVDAATRFVAGAFAVAKLPQKTAAINDPRFEILL